MGEIDKQKELIGALKVYLGFLLAIILSTGTGIAKLYGSDSSNDLLFWLGVVILICAIIVFGLVSRKMHRLISKLKDL